jgi:hypothetical protein
MVGREQCGKLAADCRADQNCAGRTGRVKNGQQIIHTLLKRRELCGRYWIGQPSPALIEENDAAECRKSINELGKSRLLPKPFQMRNPARDEDDVYFALSDGLIGDAGIPITRISCVQCHQCKPLRIVPAMLRDVVNRTTSYLSCATTVVRAWAKLRRCEGDRLRRLGAGMRCGVRLSAGEVSLGKSSADRIHRRLASSRDAQLGKDVSDVL